MKSLREKVYLYVKKKYGTAPEYLWDRYPGFGVLRHGDNNKWYGIIMDVSKERLGFKGNGKTDILNVKLGDPVMREMLLENEGYLKAYHMGGNWISILLDGTVSFDNICGLLDESFIITASKQRQEKDRPPKDWIIPANPKYYDIEHAFDNTNTIDWKQGRGIKVGDTVFMYVANPVSAILYKCSVVKTDIPFDYSDKNLSIKSLMKIKLLRKYHRYQF